MKRTLLICTLAMVSNVVISQHRIEAQLIDSLTSRGIAYANLGIPNYNVGTLTNEGGYFKFLVDDSLPKPIKISALGYETRTVELTDLKGQVALPPIPNKEPELVPHLPDRVWRFRGTRVRKGYLSMGVGGRSTEIAVRIAITEPGTAITSFFVRLVKGGSDTVPAFRINIYQPDIDGKPGVSLLRENIIAQPESKTGLIEIDLRAYRILADQDVYVSLEWLNDPGEKGFLIASDVIGAETWIKSCSHQKWNKSRFIKPGLYARLVY